MFVEYLRNFLGFRNPNMRFLYKWRSGDIEIISFFNIENPDKVLVLPPLSAHTSLAWKMSSNPSFGSSHPSILSGSSRLNSRGFPRNVGPGEILVDIRKTVYLGVADF
jgi:hypothetical protein